MSKRTAVGKSIYTGHDVPYSNPHPHSQDCPIRHPIPPPPTHTHTQDAVDYRGLKNADQVKAFLHDSTLAYLTAGYVTLAPLKTQSLSLFPCCLFALPCILSECYLSTQTPLPQRPTGGWGCGTPMNLSMPTPRLFHMHKYTCALEGYSSPPSPSTCASRRPPPPRP